MLSLCKIKKMTDRLSQMQVEPCMDPSVMMPIIAPLTVKWTVKEKVKDYLYDAKSEVLTDNNPLCYQTCT